MYGNLPKNEATFHIEVIGGQTGLKYEGDFTVKCVLSIGQVHQMELHRTQLMGDQSQPTPVLASIATLLSMLRAHIISSPSWWKDLKNGIDILDDDVLYTIFDKVNECIDGWKSALKNKVEKPEGN